MKHKTILAPIIALAFSALALSCADSESRMPFANAATAVINLAHSDAPDQALSVDTPIRGGRGGAVGEPVALFDRVKIKITGADIGTIEKNMPYSDSITMDVPAGSLRRFEVTVYTAPYDPDNPLTWTAAKSFQGVTSVNLPAGISVSIPVLMNLYETRVVVPDYLNNRVVQFNSPADADSTWESSEYFSNHGIYPLNPTDVDFDARGRILIANNPGSMNNIYRINTIFDISSQPCLLTGEINEIVAMAVDRKRNILYYATDNYGGGVALKYVGLLTIPASVALELNNPPVLPGPQPLFYSISAMDVADDGSLYITGIDSTYMPILIKYNPLVLNGVLVGQPFTETESSWFYPRDVMVRGGNVYVLNNPGDSYGFALLQFQFGPASGGLGFTLGPHFGSLAYGSPPDKGLFYGPQRFAARREDTLIIIDEGDYFDGNFHSVDRLVFTDFDPFKPWYAFGSTGYGKSEFNFYSYSSC